MGSCLGRGGELQEDIEEGGGREGEDRIGVTPAIDGPLGRGFAVLGFADEADDALQGAVPLRAGHLDDQAAPGVQRPPGDVGAGLFGGGFRFAGEVGFVHRALAGQDFAVRRHQFAGQDDDAVAGKQGGHRHLGFRVIRT